MTAQDFLCKAHPKDNQLAHAESWSDGVSLYMWFIDDLAIKKVNRSIGVTSVPWIVRHHADCCAFLMQLAEQVHNGFAVLRIEIACRLIGKQDRRRAPQRTRDRDSLLLTARELRWIVFHPVSFSEKCKFPSNF